MTQYSSLQGFLQSYLHEDWMLDADSPFDLISDYISSAGAVAGLQLIGEVNVALRSHTSDQALRALILSLGSRYDPVVEKDDSARQWLTELADAVTAEIAALD